MNDIQEIKRDVRRILDFLDIQEHRLTRENAQYAPDTLQKLISDTMLAVLRDTYVNRREFDASSDYILDRVIKDGPRLFRSDYIPRKYGYMDYDSRYEIFRYALSLVPEVEGIMLEFGVFQGGSIEFMTRYTDNPIYGFDSFEGLPERWIPGSLPNRFSTQGKIPQIDAPNVQFVPGWFDDTVPGFMEEHAGDRIKFIHFDCDLYSSHKIVFDELLRRGFDLQDTIVLFDEYLNFPGWRDDAHRALQEFTDTGPWGYRYVGFTTRYTSAAIQLFRK
jgi:hypothetical protein